jgi:hypothetical protein
MNLINESFALTSYAVYPDAGNNLAYPVLGFIDELGEYLAEMVSVDKNRMVEEILDLYWYLNQVSYELSMLYGTAFERHMSYSGKETYITEVIPAIANLAGVAKKIMRDGKPSAYKKQDRALVSLNVLRDFVFTQFANLDLELTDVITALHTKLGSRQQRGVLQGDGDHR